MPAFVNSDTACYHSVILENIIRREYFDPANKEHLTSLKKFLKTGSWGEIQFYAEYPCISVPETVMRKMCMFHLNEKKK